MSGYLMLWKYRTHPDRNNIVLIEWFIAGKVNIKHKREGDSMASTNVTIRMDETLKSRLQELMSNLGLDLTTFFTMAAKQAVREQALPFHPDMKSGTYNAKAYRLAMQNTKYNADGKAVISADDEWVNESEWDDIFQKMKRNARMTISYAQAQAGQSAPADEVFV